MLAMPIHQLTMLCLTVAYYPSHEKEFLAHEIENVMIPSCFLDRFLEDSKYVFGMDEFPYSSEDEFEVNAPTVLEYLKEWRPGLCPHIVNALYVDEMGKVKIVSSGIDVTQNWAISKGFGG